MTPTRETILNKCRFDLFQAEEVTKFQNLNENTIGDTKELHENLKKEILARNIVFSSSSIKLGRILQNDDNFHPAMQEILIYEDKHAKSFNLSLSSPHETIVYEIEDSDSK